MLSLADYRGIILLKKNIPLSDIKPNRAGSMLSSLGRSLVSSPRMFLEGHAAKANKDSNSQVVGPKLLWARI